MIGADPRISTAENYARFGREAHGQCPLYEEFGLGVSTDAAVLGLLDRLPVAKRQPNLLFAAVVYLAGVPADYRAWRHIVRTQWDDISAQMLARSTQTNEAGRCATLLPWLTRLRQPLALLEVGASAGLCLLPDRYRYAYTDSAGTVTTVGASDAGVTLPCHVDRIAVPTAVPTVVWRADWTCIPSIPPTRIRWPGWTLWSGPVLSTAGSGCTRRSRWPAAIRLG